jgi:rubrerythrin
MNKTWKCTVCGYRQEGKAPPERCPVCGAFKYRFILEENLPWDLEKKLREAFAGESKAYIRNLAFAKKAEQEGLHQIARLFLAVAEAEKIHAEEYLKYLEGVIGTTEENLKTAFENEMRAKTEFYPDFIKEAFARKREDVAWSFIRSRDVEERHAKLYKNALTALVIERDLQYHVCPVCGYVFDEELPDRCPVCGSERSTYRAISKS